MCGKALYMVVMVKWTLNQKFSPNTLIALAVAWWKWVHSCISILSFLASEQRDLTSCHHYKLSNHSLCISRGSLMHNNACIFIHAAIKDHTQAKSQPGNWPSPSRSFLQWKGDQLQWHNHCKNLLDLILSSVIYYFLLQNLYKLIKLPRDFHTLFALWIASNSLGK